MYTHSYCAYTWPMSHANAQTQMKYGMHLHVYDVNFAFMPYYVLWYLTMHPGTLGKAKIIYIPKSIKNPANLKKRHIGFMYPIPILCFYTIPICLFFKFAGFLIYLSPFIIYTTMYISVKGGKPPIKINNREKWLLSWK